MLSRTQAIRWSGQSISNGRQRLPAGRKFSSLITRPSNIHTRPSKSIHSTRDVVFQHQTRNLSLFGWGSSSKSAIGNSPTSPQDFSTAHPPPNTTYNPSYLESGRTFKASHATSDAPDPSLLQQIPPGDHEPALLQSIEDAITAPHGAYAHEDIATAVERSGYLKEVCGIDFGWGTSTLFQYAVENLHLYSGLSWSMTFVVLGIIARLALVRTTIRAQDSSAKMKEIQPVLGPLRAEYKLAASSGDRIRMQTASNQIRAVTRGSGISMFATFKPMLYSVPLSIAGFRLGSAMAALPVPALEQESFLWIDNLTLTDPWILPVFCAGMGYMTMKYNFSVNGPPQSGTQSATFQNIMLYAIPIVSVFFLHFQPAIVQIWFAVQATFTNVQSLALARPQIRNLVGLPPRAVINPPPPPSNSSTPSSTNPSSPNPPPQQTTTEIAGMRIRSSATTQSYTSPPPPPRPTPTSNSTSTQPNATNPPQKISSIDRAINATKSRLSGVSSSWDKAKEYGQTSKAKSQAKQNARQREAYEYQRRQDAVRELEWRNQALQQQQQQKSSTGGAQKEERK